MNVIFIMSDSYRRDNLAAYGPSPVVTPNLDRFAGQAYVFHNARTGSFPTVPNRLDITSGRFSHVAHEWCPLPADTITLQQLLTASGMTTQMIVDNPHLQEDGFNYGRGFAGWEWIRGQSIDAWRNTPKDVPPINTAKNHTPWVLRNYLRNTAWWQGEEDRFAARTVNEACRWLESAAPELDHFYLHIDMFDPHEPWDAPKHYTDRKSNGCMGESESSTS